MRGTTESSDASDADDGLDASGSTPTREIKPADAHLAALAASIAGVETVLDAPAGRGEVAAALHEHGFQVTAVDIQPANFDVPGLRCWNSDLNRRLEFDDACFDLVVCRDGIEQLDSHSYTLGEFHRLLKPGGWLLLSTPNALCLRARLAFFLVGGPRLAFRPPADRWNQPGAGRINPLDYYTLRAVLRRVGFRIDRLASHALDRTSLALAPLAPLVALATRRALAREQEPLQRQSNAEIAKHILSRELLFGDSLVLLARKEAG